METKWIARSRQLWQWALVALFAIAGLDAITTDAILGPIGAFFEIDPTLIEWIRTKILIAAPFIAGLLKLWRVQRPDDRELTVIPAPVKDLVSRDSVPVLLLALSLGAIPLVGCTNWRIFTPNPVAVSEVQQPGAKLFVAGIEYGKLLGYVGAYRRSPLADPVVLAQIQDADAKVEEQRVALREAIADGQPADFAQLNQAIRDLRNALAKAGALPAED